MLKVCILFIFWAYHLHVNYRPMNKEELFNLCHSSAQNVIKCIFGILKRCFWILLNALSTALKSKHKFWPLCVPYTTLFGHMKWMTRSWNLIIWMIAHQVIMTMLHLQQQQQNSITHSKTG